MNSLFHALLHNKLLFNRVVYFVHRGYCSKYHCKLTCGDVDYVNWLVRVKRFDIIQMRLERFDPPFLSPLSHDSLCALADDISTHQLLLQLLNSNHPILKNTLVSSTVLSKIIEQQSKYNQNNINYNNNNNNYNNNIEKELIDIIIHKSISIVLDPSIYLVATTYGRLDVISTLLSRYLIAKRDGIFVSHQKFILGSKVVQLAIQLGHLHLLELYNKVEEEYGVVVYLNKVKVDVEVSLECLNWLLLNRPDISFTPQAFSKSALKGHFDSIKIIHQYIVNNNNNSGDFTTEVLLESSRANRLDIIQYLINNQLVMDIAPNVKKDMLTNVFASTSNQESIDLIVYIMERIPGKIVINVSYCANAAARSGYVKAIQYLMDKKNAKLLNNQGINRHTAREMVFAAMSNKQYKVLDYMRKDTNGGIKLGKKGFRLSKMIHQVNTHEKDTEMMDYLLDHLDQRAIKRAFKKHKYHLTRFLGNPRVFTLLLGKSKFVGTFYFDYKPFIRILAQHSVEILKLFEKYHPRSTYIEYEDLIRDAARFGNYEMVKYIHQTQKLEITYYDIKGAIKSGQLPLWIYMVGSMSSIPNNLEKLFKRKKNNSYRLVYAISEKLGKKEFKVRIPPNTSVYNWLERIDILEMFHQYIDNDILLNQLCNDSPDIVGHFFHLYPNYNIKNILYKVMSWDCTSWNYWVVILYILDLSSQHTFELENGVVERLLGKCISTGNIQIFDALLSRVTGHPAITLQLYNKLLSMADLKESLLQYLKLIPMFSSFNN